jgi:release factor glutamine methyltransferase
VLSNPPYIARREVEQLPPQIRDHEPRTALDGGEDGLDAYRQIATQCAALLRADGFLMAELGAGQFEAVREIFVAAGWRVERPLSDLNDVARVLTAMPEDMGRARLQIVIE